jgi:mono/diheme cytochrome c family protein
MPYAYANTSEGYEAAGANLLSPIETAKRSIEAGAVLYTKFCMHCHGETGQGDGGVVTNGGFPPPPAYNGAALKNLPEGKMFHSITYGKGQMGSHSSQLSKEDRWKIVQYVKVLQNDGVSPFDEVEEVNS